MLSFIALVLFYATLATLASGKFAFWAALALVNFFIWFDMKDG